MSVVILADLHLDIWAEGHKDPFRETDPDRLRAVRHCIIAGDLSNHGAKKWPRMVDMIREKMPDAEMYLLPGNHEFYGGRIDREDKLEDAAHAAGAHFIQKKTLLIDGMRFICATLWTDFRINGITSEFAAKYDVERSMNDYVKIRIEKEGFRKLYPEVTQGIHFDHLNWITAELETDFDGETVVVTHHAPHPYLCMDPTAKYAPAYASDLSQVISRFQPSAWFCGHSHSHRSFMLGDTLARNVSLGYPHELKRPSKLQDRMDSLLTDVRHILTEKYEENPEDFPSL